VTAPAVVRRWNDPPPVRVDRRVPGSGRRVEAAPAAGAAIRARLSELLARCRRAAPLGAVLFTALVIHAGLAPHLAVAGAAPDVLLVGVVAVAVRCGARTGAGLGFAAGLGADLVLATPLGTSALAYTLVGHGLGRSSRPPSSGSTAFALCRPGSACFACRTGRAHAAEPAIEPASRPSRVRRAAARRAALRRSVVLTALGVAAARLGTVVVATTLGGVPFAGTPVLLRVAGVALVSAPLGPLAGAAVGRLHRISGAPG
jgi:hypothetical protein